MMERLLARGEKIAAQAQAKQVQRLAQGLKPLFGNAAVRIQGAQVLVKGRGIIARWLGQPELRFLSGMFK